MEEKQESSQVASTTSEETSNYDFNPLHEISFGNGSVLIDDFQIGRLTDVKITSDISNVSKVTITFLAKVKGLDEV